MENTSEHVITLETLEKVLRRSVNTDSDALVAWGIKFQKDPAHALEWSKDTFRLAAKIGVYKCILKMIEDKLTLKKIYELTRDEALRRSAFGSHSTSETSNLMERFVASIWADMARELQREGGF